MDKRQDRPTSKQPSVVVSESGQSSQSGHILLKSPQIYRKKDVQKDQARFDPSKSVDLQWANGSVTHDSPNMLHKDADTTPLLIFPPSTETLETMCG